MYHDAIESHLRFPGYWHKNFALVCEKLRHLVPDLEENLRLIKVAIAHFRAYLDSGTSDPQVPAIQDAIRKLQDFVDSVDLR